MTNQISKIEEFKIEFDKNGESRQDITIPLSLLGVSKISKNQSI
jgi:hypothetical protein